MSFLFVRVETDAGLVGWGEACDSYACSFAGVLATVVTDAFAPLLIGQAVASPELHAQRLRAWTRRRLGDEGVAGPARMRAARLVRYSAACVTTSRCTPRWGSWRKAILNGISTRSHRCWREA